jgi:hypothetical protein
MRILLLTLAVVVFPGCYRGIVCNGRSSSLTDLCAIEIVESARPDPSHFPPGSRVPRDERYVEVSVGRANRVGNVLDSYVALAEYPFSGTLGTERADVRAACRGIVSVKNVNNTGWEFSKWGEVQCQAHHSTQ